MVEVDDGEQKYFSIQKSQIFIKIFKAICSPSSTLTIILDYLQAFSRKKSPDNICCIQRAALKNNIFSVENRREQTKKDTINPRYSPISYCAKGSSFERQTALRNPSTERNGSSLVLTKLFKSFFTRSNWFSKGPSLDRRDSSIVRMFLKRFLARSRFLKRFFARSNRSLKLQMK